MESWKLSHVVVVAVVLAVTTVAEEIVTQSPSPLMHEMKSNCQKASQNPDSTAIFFPMNPCSYVCVHRNFWFGIQQLHLADGEPCGTGKVCHDGQCYIKTDVEKCQAEAQSKNDTLSHISQPLFGCQVACIGSSGFALANIALEDGAPCGLARAWVCRSGFCFFR